MGAHTPTHFSLLNNSGMSNLSRCFMGFWWVSTPCIKPMIDSQTQLITEIASIPTVSSGNFIHDDNNFELNLNVRKYSSDFTKKSSYIWRSNDQVGSMTESNSEIKFRSYSPDGKILLIGRSTGEKDRFIEVWLNGGSCFSFSINVTSLHGDFLTDGKDRLTVHFRN